MPDAPERKGCRRLNARREVTVANDELKPYWNATSSGAEPTDQLARSHDRRPYTSSHDGGIGHRTRRNVKNRIASARNARRIRNARSDFDGDGAESNTRLQFSRDRDRPVNGRTRTTPLEVGGSVWRSRTCGLFSKLARWSCRCTASRCHVQSCDERSTGSAALFRRSWCTRRRG